VSLRQLAPPAVSSGTSTRRESKGLCSSSYGLRSQIRARLARNDLHDTAGECIQAVNTQCTAGDLGDRGWLGHQEETCGANEFDGAANNACSSPEAIARAAALIDGLVLEYRRELQRRQYDL